MMEPDFPQTSNLSDSLSRATGWLLANAGSVVRWRTASELCRDVPRPELKRLENDLLAFSVVQEWLGRLDLGETGASLDHIDPETLKRMVWSTVHGSKRTSLENVLGRLAEFGLAAGMPPVDERMLPLRRIFLWQPSWQADAQVQSAWESLVKSIFAWGLLRLSYPPDAAMKDYLYKHVEIVHKIAAEKIYDIYATPEELIGVPQAWAGKPVMKQEIMANYHLPLIHDLYLLAHLPPEMLDEQTAVRVEAIVDYVLDPRFQSLQDGYGYAWIKARRTCYGWGWSPHLPGFREDGFAAGEGNLTALVPRLELMAHFPRARRSAWFQQSLQHLEGFRTEQGTYRFPPGYLIDRPDGYYVSGFGMGLGEDRRKKIGLEIESTFRILKIKNYVPTSLNSTNGTNPLG